MKIQKRKYFIFLFLLFYTVVAKAEESASDTVSVVKRPVSLSIKGEYGTVLKTNDFVKGGHYNYESKSWDFSSEDEVNNFAGFALRYAAGLKSNDWRAKAYRDPYYGIGLFTATFNDSRFGTPISLYLMYGARIAQITRWLTFNYELNLGYSTNWNHYNRFDNPDNITIGSRDNIHLSAGAYLRFSLCKYLDLNLGAAATHFSNGATCLPNKGMNAVAPYLILSYKMNPEVKDTRDTPLQKPAKMKKYRLDHDVSLTLSSRHIYYDTKGTSLSTQYVDYSHRVYAFSYAPMLTRSYKYKFGLSLDLLYDESANATADYVLNEDDQQYYEKVTLGNVEDRFALGVSLKGEIVMPYFSIFANVGYNVIHNNDLTNPFYQMAGVKIQPTGKLFGVMGIRSNYFSKAQFICWSIGYTFKGKEE